MWWCRRRDERRRSLECQLTSRRLLAEDIPVDKLAADAEVLEELEEETFGGGGRVLRLVAL